MRGGSELLNRETKRKELLKLRITARLLKTAIEPFRLERKREEGNREIKPASKQGFTITNNNWKIE